MADRAAQLDYADPKRERGSRWRRRLWLASVVVGAIAVGVVGRKFYGRVVPAIAYRIESVADQRRIDALNPASVGLDLTLATTRPLPADPKRDAIAAAAAPVLTRSGLTYPPHTTTVAVLRLRNARGDDRMAIVAVRPERYTIGSISLNIEIFPPATYTGGFQSRRHGLSYGGLAGYRDRLRFEAPSVDPGAPNVITIRGSADGRPFIYAITIRADDSPEFVELRTPATTPTE